MIQALLSRNPVFQHEIMRILRGRAFLYSFFLVNSFHFFLFFTQIQHTFSFSGRFPAYIFYPIANFIYAFMLLGSFAFSFLHENNHNNDDLMTMTGLTPQRIVNGRFWAFITLLLLNLFMSLPFCLLSFYNYHYSLHPNCLLLPLCHLITIPIYQIMAILAANPNKYLRNGFTLFWLPMAAFLIIFFSSFYVKGITIYQLDLATYMYPITIFFAIGSIPLLYFGNIFLVTRQDPLPGLYYRILLVIFFIIGSFIYSDEKSFQIVLTIIQINIFIGSYRFCRSKLAIDFKQRDLTKPIVKLLTIQHYDKKYNLWIYLFVILLGLIPAMLYRNQSTMIAHSLLLLLYPFFMHLFEWVYNHCQQAQKRPVAYKIGAILILISLQIAAIGIYPEKETVSLLLNQPVKIFVLLLYAVCVSLGFRSLIKQSFCKEVN